MTVINRMADFVSGITFDALPHDTVEHLKMHLLDTIGAMLAGAGTREGAATGRLLKNFPAYGEIPAIGYQTKAALLTSIIAECSATRCTEVDDIHLRSCTTPGSIVIPTALSLANASCLSDPKEFLVALAVGYEILIRFGMAINGPKALYQGVWPTYLAAPLGSAAVAAKALKLSSEQTSGALSTALTLSTGVEGRIKRDLLFTRWLTVGVAAQNGVIAALAAREGFTGDDGLLDTINKQFYGLKLYHEELTDGLGERFSIDDTGMKPYSVARQGLSAVEAFREIISNNDLDPESIQEVSICVPKRFAARIDHPNLPDNRLKTIPNVRYQIALAAFEPEKLFDAMRKDISKDRRIPSLMEKVQIKASKGLERYYPAAWPARVEIRTDAHKYSCKMLHPRGDSCNRFSWDEVIHKFNGLVVPVLGEAAGEQVAQWVQHADANRNTTQLLKLLSPGLEDET